VERPRAADDFDVIASASKNAPGARGNILDHLTTPARAETATTKRNGAGKTVLRRAARRAPTIFLPQPTD